MQLTVLVKETLKTLAYHVVYSTYTDIWKTHKNHVNSKYLDFTKFLPDVNLKYTIAIINCSVFHCLPSVFFI